MLCGICGILFIIASTATKFILDRKRLNPAKQLSLLLEGVSPSSFVGSKYNNVLDETYLRIILAAQSELDVSDDNWYRELNNLLGALITLLTPLPCDALASLLDMDPDDIEATLSQLHSLVAPTGSGENLTFRIHHKSFPDFITDKNRINRVLEGWTSALRPDLDSLLWINVGDHHRRLAKACFRIMNRDLKWNMANIREEEWYKDMEDIPYIGPQLISRDLTYASLHWASHLRSARGLDRDLKLQNNLEEWASRHLLAWMEVMIILGKVHEVVMILQAAIESVYKKVNAWLEPESILELLSDACRLVQQQSEIMKISPMHLYHSCLPFVPMKTSLYRLYSAKATMTLSIGRGYEWDPLLATLIGHSDSVSSVAFSNDDSRIASGSNDGTIRLWDAKTGTHIRTLTDHSYEIHAVAFSGDGSQLASGSSDGTVRVWDAKTGAHTFTRCGHSSGVHLVSFSADSSQLASVSLDETLCLWNVKTGLHISTFTGHRAIVSSIAFSAADLQLALGSDDGTIQLWDTKTNACVYTLTGHLGLVLSIAFSRDKSLLASASVDETVRLWNLKAGTLVFTLTGHLLAPYTVAFSVNGALLASGSCDETVRLWDTTTGAHISTFTGHSGRVRTLAFSGDGLRLLAGTEHGEIQVWNVEKRGDVSYRINDFYTVLSIAFSNDGSRLASASSDKTIRIYNANTGTIVTTLTSHLGLFYPVAFSGDVCRLASASSDNTIQLWDAYTGAPIVTLTGHSNIVTYITFSMDGSRLASGSYDTTIRVWDANTGTPIFILTGHSQCVNSLAFSSDGSQLASGSYDCTARLWDAKTGAHLLTLFDQHGFQSLLYLHDSSQLVSRSSGSVIRFWDVKTGAPTSSLLTPSNLTAESITFPAKDTSSWFNTFYPAHLQLLQYQITKPMSFLLLVSRKTTHINGLVVVKQLLNGMWEAIPVCWFPHDLKVMNIAYNSSESQNHWQVAISCRKGRLTLLNFPCLP